MPVFHIAYNEFRFFNAMLKVILNALFSALIMNFILPIHANAQPQLVEEPTFVELQATVKSIKAVSLAPEYRVGPKYTQDVLKNLSDGDHLIIGVSPNFSLTIQDIKIIKNPLGFPDISSLFLHIHSPSRTFIGSRPIDERVRLQLHYSINEDNLITFIQAEEVWIVMKFEATIKEMNKNSAPVTDSRQNKSGLAELSDITTYPEPSYNIKKLQTFPDGGDFFLGPGPYAVLFLKDFKIIENPIGFAPIKTLNLHIPKKSGFFSAVDNYLNKKIFLNLYCIERNNFISVIEFDFQEEPLRSKN